ncbi:hypothetical protein [Duganella sp. Root1480D1]|uniref:hypothetical protein n=1 Tax=Duganella sp. Root1480D1 TaxID=1736471 RepID=UPI0012E382BA|nr:hypothetical protein [Duganella sp. Root1480D1]
MNIWHILGIDPTHDTRAIKLAYAGRLKQINQEQSPSAFQALREAYEQALAAPPQPPAARQPDALAGLPPLPPPQPGQRPLPPARTPFSVLPPLPELPLDAPLAKPIALELAPESEAALAQQASQRWLPGPRPQSYGRAGPQLRPGPQPPAPAEAADMICQALARLPAEQQRAEIARWYAQPGWGNSAFRSALETALVTALEQQFSQRYHMVPAFHQALGWEQWAAHSPNCAAIERLEGRWHARIWLQKFDSWPAEHPMQRALQLLSSPADPLRCAAFARDPEQLSAMLALIEHLEDEDEAVRRYAIDFGAFQWWQQYGRTLLLALVPDEAPPQRARRGRLARLAAMSFKRKLGAILLVLWTLLRLL